jgi:YbbR domain-containing protein
MVWLIVTAKQGGILTVTAPVRFHGLPDSVALIRNTPEEVEVQLKVFSLLAPSPKQLDLVADLDLSKVKQGNNTVAIRPEDFKVPLGMLVTSVTPSTARVAVERKVRRTLKVQVKTSGVLAGRGRLRGIVTDPATVLVEGPEQAVLQLDGIRTETVDLTEISRNSVLEKRLVPPDPPVRLLREEPVRVRVLVTGR